jgi:histidinol phosphatase-like enzyme
VDPRVPLATSVRALDALKRDGLVEAVGLCNVTVGQIEDARRITGIASIQIELSPWNDSAILNGVVEYCLAHGILVLAYRPLGGVRRRARVASDPVLAAIAARHGVTPFQVALAWLHHLSPQIVGLPGPTRVESAASLKSVLTLHLTDEDRSQLDERFTGARLLRLRRSRSQPARTDGEIVLIMGLPGAGKSTLARQLAGDGYTRLNRDEAGGPLNGLLPPLERLIESGGTRIVLDNTYLSRRSRGAVIATALQHGLPVRCVWLTTAIEDAQVNAATRIVQRYGRLLTPEEIRSQSRRDPAAFGPGAQFRLQRELEPPETAEGFSRIDVVPFERRGAIGFSSRAVIFWVDGVLRRSRSDRRTATYADEVEVLAGRTDVLRRYADAGWLLLGISWHPEIADGSASASDVEAGFARTRELLGVDLPIEYCPHPGGPPICWCRKPLPGLGVVLIERHGLDPAQCVYVGAGPQDPGFARRLGFVYRDAADFFDAPEPD